MTRETRKPVDLGKASQKTRGQPFGLYAEIVGKTDRPMLSDD
jgi:hypothetical protein